MTQPVEIRFATEADNAAITAIYGEAVANGTGSFELEGPSETEMAARFASLKAGNFPFFVAERDGAVIGFAYAGPYRERPAYRFTVQDAIYLAPEARGQGIGRLLLTALIAEAGRRGFRQMIGIVGNSQNHASIGLHRSLGFEEVGTLRNVGWKHGRWLDTVFAQLILGEGAEEPPSEG